MRLADSENSSQVLGKDTPISRTASYDVESMKLNTFKDVSDGLKALRLGQL